MTKKVQSTDPVEIALHLLYDFAAGQISKDELRQHLETIKVGDSTLGEHSEARKRDQANEAAGRHAD